MSGIICWACLKLAISVLQFVLLPWQSEFNKNQEKNESQQNQDLWWIWQRGCQRSCRLRLHQAWGRHGTNLKILGKSVVVDDRSGQLDRFSPAGYSKSDYHRSWSSQEWKREVAAHDRSGKPEKTSWDMRQQVRPHREEPLLDGNAHSVRYEEMIHDGSG